jgi:hypothetical protein
MFGRTLNMALAKAIAAFCPAMKKAESINFIVALY